jgi:hypothetical protein
MAADDRDDAAVAWLLTSTEPAVRYLTRRDLLGEESRPDRDAILDGARVRALFAGQQPDGGFGGSPYRKWWGAHWRLVSLVEHAIPEGEPRAVAAVERVLTWLTGRGRLERMPPPVRGLLRRHASIEGNALAACARLGLAADPRVAALASALVEWQWPDGGWNCDPNPAAHRSSFHETLGSMWGLHEYAAATGDEAAAKAVQRAGELFLEHRLFRSLSTSEPIRRDFTELHYPPYWHYDVLQALVVLGRAGLAGDPRTADAVALLRERQRPDGRWRASRRWWSPPGTPGKPSEAVDWGSGADEMATLNALRALQAAATP